MLRQVVVVDGVFYIVRRLVFGNRMSPRAWCAVSSLFAWIVSVVFRIEDVHDYMDDFWGWDEEGNTVFFHGRLRPVRQVYLLLFWDMIRCPYDDIKQLDGSPLKIIGFWVDINLGAISIPPSSVEHAVEAITKFIATPSRKLALREWSHLAGYLNWILNVFPWGRPALTEMYRKMAGKTHTYASIFLNREVIADLVWFKDLMPRAIGVSFADNGRWPDDVADLIAHTDATLTSAIAFVYSNQAFIYQIRDPAAGLSKPDIFFFEELAVVSAISHAASLPRPPKRILIFCDNLDTVHAFNSLRVSQSIHNAPLLAAATIVAISGIDMRQEISR